MSIEKEEKKIIQKMIRNLIFLKSALENKFKTKINTKAFSNIISDLKTNGKLDYKSHTLEIEFDKENIPKYFSKDQIKKLKISFSVNVKAEIDNLLKNKDPFSQLEFNIYARGTSKQSKPLMYSMHFDRHLEGENESKEIHPIYHFQFGGRKIEDEDIDRGDILFFDAPRLMHHPMEFILGIDFLLSNFFPNEWKEISRKNPNYKKIVQEYQQYFVLPYFKSVVDHFDRKTHPMWSPKEIYPQLVDIR